MKKAYFLVPLIGVLIFVGIHWNFQKEFDVVEAQRKEAREKARQEKVQQDVEARRKAAEDAIASQERRKKEKALEEAQDQAQKDARLALQDAREKAYRDREKLSKQVDRLKSDVAVENEAIAKVEKAKKSAQDEEVALRAQVKLAESNRTSLEDVLNKIKAADDAAVKMAAEAAAAATKKEKDRS